MKKLLLFIVLAIFGLPLKAEEISYIEAQDTLILVDDHFNKKSDFRPSYMGTVEAGHIFPWSHFLRVTHGMVTLTTIHGVRLKPWLFTGAGLGALMSYHKNGIGLTFPLYLNCRLTLPEKHFRPFFDLKFGTTFSACTFFNPSIGYKYAWSNKGGIRISLGANIFTSCSFKPYNGISAILGFDF